MIVITIKYAIGEKVYTVFNNKIRPFIVKGVSYQNGNCGEVNRNYDYDGVWYNCLPNFEGRESFVLLKEDDLSKSIEEIFEKMKVEAMLKDE